MKETREDARVTCDLGESQIQVDQIVKSSYKKGKALIGPQVTFQGHLEILRTHELDKAIHTSLVVILSLLFLGPLLLLSWWK